MNEPQTTQPDVVSREAAWTTYQDQLGNLTAREEAMIERAFKSGWSARDTIQMRPIMECEAP